MVQVMRWQEGTAPDEQTLRQRMQKEGLSPYAWSNGPAYHYAAHLHTYEKVLYCVRGSIRFVLPDQPDGTEQETAIDLQAGDGMILPAGTRHSALVGPQGVTCIEAAR